MPLSKEQMREYMFEYRKKNPNNAQKKLEQKKEKYAIDPEYRTKKIEYGKQKYQEIKYKKLNVIMV